MSSRRGQRRHKLVRCLHATSRHALCSNVTYARFARPGASLPTSAARSMLAGEPLPIPSGRRSREIIQILWPAEQTLVARASCEKDRADIHAGGLATVDRRLDFTPNPALSLRVRLRSNRDSTIGLVAEGLPRLLPRRGETIGQAAEIVVIGKVFWSRLSCGPNVAGLALELLRPRGRHQPEIVFGVLEIVLRGDRVAGCVSVARQLKVSLRHMQRRAANSDVGPARVI
jgi:hypothetical protein